MGYYTTYTNCEPIMWSEEMKQELVNIQPDCFPTTDSVEEWLEYGEEMKWYDNKKDMTELSRRFPEILFKIHCSGEDGDEWINYFMNGTSTTCQGVMTFEEFDPKNLK